MLPLNGNKLTLPSFSSLLNGQLKHAHISIETGDALGHEKEIKVQYNPETLSLSQAAVVDGTGNKVLFRRTEPDNLVVSLVFDSYDEQADIRAETDKILNLTRPQKAKGGKVPPTVRFAWADRLFTGIVVHVEQRFTMFLSTGIPVRAELTVTIKEVLNDRDELDALGLRGCRKLFRVSAGDHVSSVAYKVLGDRTQWRLIADANGIYDPIAFARSGWLGQTIAIPDTHNETFEPAGAPDHV
jgi:hypothetical protein